MKVLFEAGNVLTRPKNLTANDLYHEMIKLQVELSHAAMCEEDLDVRNLANSFWEKFDVYWRGCFLVLAVAVVMDPRCKMEIVKANFTEMYGEEDAEKWIKTVSDAVHDLYLSYGEQNLMDANVDHGLLETTESHQHEGEHKVEKQELGDDSQAQPQADEDYHMGDVLLQEGTTLVTIGDSLSDFEIFLTELNRYLGETLVLGSEDFDVLRWWRVNNTNYPILSKIAADILPIPCSTVSPDSVFDTEVKEMDNYRISLPSGTLEAKDWLKNPKTL